MTRYPTADPARIMYQVTGEEAAALTAVFRFEHLEHLLARCNASPALAADARRALASLQVNARIAETVLDGRRLPAPAGPTEELQAEDLIAADGILTTSEAAARIGITRRHVRNLVHRGVLTIAETSTEKRIQVTETSVDQYLATRADRVTGKSLISGRNGGDGLGIAC